MKNLSVLILTDSDSWIAEYVEEFRRWLEDVGCQAIVTDRHPDSANFELCFMLSYSQIVNKEQLGKCKHNLVVHESALPQGKGWSPLTWQILEGKAVVPICLFEAAESVDAGDIYIQREMKFAGTELVEGLRQVQGRTTIAMCQEFVARYPVILQEARQQQGMESFYPRRRPEDSRLDMNKTLAEQFELLRVVDNQKYPAFFEYRGRKYRLEIYGM